MIIVNNYSANKEDLQKYTSRLANKIHQGFVIVEKNDKLPFAVLTKKATKVDHNLNFLIFCATFGLWTLPWIYISQVSSKEKNIVVAIDEDGNTFEDKCF
ncbi:hypothetical protein [Flavobacterium sp.]|uniref:hypothetical protein n=1 Tax=Flavobacterium sp. TaxID=239 RepID=UPI00286B5162|nr:hypothetical protein [Flavobacterium sp.]